MSRSRVEIEKYRKASWGLKVKLFESALAFESNSELIRDKSTHRSVKRVNTKPIQTDTRDISQLDSF